MAMTQGMHHSIPQHQAVEVAMMEHRTRLWWTVYILDRLCTTMMSHPISIPDTDIDVRLPSDHKLIPALAGSPEMIDHEFIIATISLARICGEIASSLYTRVKAQRSSLHRVQSLLKSLQNWHDTLPSHLLLPKSKPLWQVARPVATMHLLFNQVSLHHFQFNLNTDHPVHHPKHASRSPLRPPQPHHPTNNPTLHPFLPHIRPL